MGSSGNGACPVPVGRSSFTRPASALDSRSQVLGSRPTVTIPPMLPLVITGDGEQLMGIGSLATIGAKGPKNLSIMVLDNGHSGETGMQRSHSSLGTSLAAVAKGCGIRTAFTVERVDAAAQVAQHVNAREGTVFAQVFISADEPPRALPPRDGVFVKNRFRAALGFAPF